MAITVTHSKVSTIPDGDDSSLIRPSDWNDTHVLSGTVPVANGGTGASTLTGYVKGNGTSAMTASATVPISDITGLGTMSTQNANAVAITGGNIDGTTIGGTTPAVITGSTINANTKVVSPDYYAQSILGGNLRTSGGTSLVNWDGGGSGNVTINGGLLANPANKNISIAPTGTGTATINPATAGTMNNMVIGGTTAAAGSFTDLSVTGTTKFDGSEGTAGQVLTSAGTGNTPTWTTPTTGTVTSVTGTAPVVSSGGTTPAISMPAANTTTNGYLTSTDWNTFNGKAPALTYTTNYVPYGQGTTTPALSANFTFNGTNLTVGIAGVSSRIQGDFSNATVSTRTAFQTGTTNGSTGIYALPNGTSTAASWQTTNAADPTNASKILIATNGSTDVQLVSGINGTGTYLPMTFYNNGAEKMRLSVAGGFAIGSASDAGAGNLLVQNTITATKYVGVSGGTF